MVGLLPWTPVHSDKVSLHQGKKKSYKQKNNSKQTEKKNNKATALH